MKREDRAKSKLNPPNFIPDEPHPEPNQKHTEKETTDRHVYIDSRVKIDFVEDIKKEKKASDEDETTHRKKQLFWTKVASVLLVITAFFTGCQLKVARDTFYASERPYIGVANINSNHQFIGDDGQPHASKGPTPQTTGLNIGAEIHNFGPVPGENYVASLITVIGNTATPMVEKEVPSILFPTQSRTYPAVIDGDVYRDVMQKRKRLTIQVRVSYDGPRSGYTYCDEQEYNPQWDEFEDLGPCT